MARQMKSPQQARDKYQRRVGSAAQDYKAGVQAATGWADAAVAAGARRDAGLQAAIADGRIDAGIQRRGDAGWKAATITKGVQNWGPAAASAGPQYEQGMTRAMQYQQAAQAATASIDTSTLAGRLEKSRVWQATVAEAARVAKSGR